MKNFLMSQKIHTKVCVLGFINPFLCTYLKNTIFAKRWIKLCECIPILSAFSFTPFVWQEANSKNNSQKRGSIFPRFIWKMKINCEKTRKGNDNGESDFSFYIKTNIKNVLCKKNLVWWRESLQLVYQIKFTSSKYNI